MRKYLKFAMAPAIASIALLASCGKKTDSTKNSTGGSNAGSNTTASTQPVKSATFTLDGKTIKDGDNLTIAVGENLKVITAKNVTTVTYSSSAADILEVAATTGKLNAKKAGNAVITAAADGKEYKFNFTVAAPTTEAGIFSYADSSYEEKAKILGVLEKYAVDNYLTGITLFSDGGKVVYNSRYTPKPQQYVVGYGWGTEREGKLTGELEHALGGHKDYYQSGMVKVPNRADAMNATGSDVSTLSGYITSAYYGTRLNSTNDGYEWYPILALTDEPIPLEEDGKDGEKTKVKVNNDLTQSDRWRIYVRTGDGNYKTQAPQYKTASNISVFKKYNNTTVQAEDYLTPFKWMLTSANGQVRGAELLDGVSGIYGAANYYAASGDKTKLGNNIYDVDDWKKYIENDRNIAMGSDEKGTYIDFRLTVPCTQFFAKYYLSSNLYSPLPAEILKEYPKYGTEPTTNDTLSQTTISCGAYYISERPNTTSLTFARNDNFVGRIYNKNANGVAIDEWTDGSQPREIYQIPGIQWSMVEDEQRENIFRDGQVDAYTPDKSNVNTTYKEGEGEFSDTKTKWKSYQTEAEATFKINVNALTANEWKNLFGTSGKVYSHNSTVTNTWVKERNTRAYMSDKNFLDFLSFGLDRKTIAETRGKQPTQDYFANAYVYDPENGKVYNNTEYHKAALADRHNDTYGYDKTDAANALRSSIQNVISKIKDLPTEGGKKVVRIDMNWMNTSDTKDYGDVFDSWKSIFEEVSKKYFGGQYVLDIKQNNGTSDYNAVYDKMKHGEFDLGFGAISGNTMNPLNFFEVLKSDNSSGFTLNWGKDTSEVTDEIVYDNKKWSFDSLWNAGNTVAVLNKNAQIAAPTTDGYDTTTWLSDSAKKQVSYEIAFDDLIAAGATINTIHGATDAVNGKTLYQRDTATTKIDENNKTFRVVLGSVFNNTGVEGTKNRQTDIAATVTLTVSYTIKVGGTEREMTATLSLANYFSVRDTIESK